MEKEIFLSLLYMWCSGRASERSGAKQSTIVAPWPPEQTKSVVHTIIDPPQAAQTVEQQGAHLCRAETEQSKIDVKIIEPAASNEKKFVASKKPFPFKKVIVMVLTVAVIAGISIAVFLNKQRATAYEMALQNLSNGNYVSARQGFLTLSGYRDAAPLYLYCKYANVYESKTNYTGGLDELLSIRLQYDTIWQQDIDTLIVRVMGYKKEKDAADERAAAENAAKREQALKDRYAGKLPVAGMPMSCLKYTSLGAPDKEEKCLNFDHLVEDRRSISVWWYRSDGKVLAAGTCFKHKDDSEFMLFSFSYYDYSISNKGQTFNYGGGGNHSGRIRDDYDDPEDLWDDNQDWYEDEDEAWDEWYDDWSVIERGKGPLSIPQLGIDRGP